MIASFIDGRVRLRSEALRDLTAMEMVRAAVSARDGVVSATPNPRTGSLLVLYDPAKISRETLAGAAVLLESQLRAFGVPRQGAKRPGRKSAGFLCPKHELSLLGGLFGLTLFSAFFSKKVHIGVGALMAAMTCKHLLDRRSVWRRAR